MPTRIVIAPSIPSGTFPRWGYLDKYAVNEYMARAFALTATIVFALDGAMHLLHVGTAPLVAPAGRPETICLATVQLQPPPALLAKAEPVAVGGGGTRIRPPVFTPVPARGFDADVVPSAGGTGTGPPQDGAAEPESPSLELDLAAGSGPAWPSPDDLLVVEKEPVLIAMQPPLYPEVAREARVEGTVLLRLLVDAQGTVRDLHVLQSIRGLDEAALAAAATAVFRPALQHDRPVAIWVVVPIDFRLRD